MARILYGKEVSSALWERLLPRIDRLRAHGVAPTLAIVRVGERPDDLSYERTILKRAEAAGVAVRTVSLDADVSQAVFESLAGVFADTGEGFPPATAQACLETLDFYDIPVAGKRVVVLGRSLVIGRPVAMMLLARHATVTLAHSRTADVAAHTREADIVVCATGRARAYGAEYFSPGQTVLDVGINFDEAGNLCGDVDFNAVASVLGEDGAITPVPRGLGGVTTSVTMAHVVRAAEVALRR